MRNLMMAILVAGVIGSALSLVYARHQNRVLFVDLQGLHAERDELALEWGRLQIEQSAQATHGEIDARARDKLNMVIPDTARVRIIDLR